MHYSVSYVQAYAATIELAAKLAKLQRAVADWSCRRPPDT